MNEQVLIREATIEDSQFLSELMESTLNTYYTEDHKEKALKILDAHLNKTDKNFGLLTLEQKVFIITLNGIQIGMVDLVTKRQNTFKISPIIIKSEFRNKGYGTLLYDYIEKYVSKKKGRQIFCTVSEESGRTINFFFKNNFNIAGKCIGYQKKDVTEFLLYKDLHFSEQEKTAKGNYQIVLAEEKDKEFVTAAFGKYFSNIVESIDEKLYEKLFKATNNSKKNEIYISATKDTEIVGLAVASKKKSGIIKVLPIVHQDQEVFSQLIQFLPKNFQGKGFRKIYLQTFTDAYNVILLQKFQWTLEGVLPNSYKDNSVTLLWTKELI
jgi:ribosomal protein S18 acetylase RimI-like enzyme